MTSQKVTGPAIAAALTLTGDVDDPQTVGYELAALAICVAAAESLEATAHAIYTQTRRPAGEHERPQNRLLLAGP